MNIPNPPTDNLYKFLAISGVVLAVACIAFNTATYASFSTQREDGLNELRLFQEKQEAFSNKLDEVKKTSGPVTPELKAEANELDKNLDIIGNKVDAIRKPFDKTTRLQNIGVIIGIAAAATGFTLWYFKLQRYEDTIIRTKALTGTSKK